MFQHDIGAAVRRATDRPYAEPIEHATACDIATALKTELWRREAGVPSALREFIEDGRFVLYELRSAVAEVADDLNIDARPEDASIVRALVRYADYHQDSTLRRKPVAGWAKLTGQEVST